VCGILSTDIVDDIENNVFHESGRLNSTWGGNIVDMFRFKKYLVIIYEENLVENARVMGDYLLEKLHSLEEKYPALVTNARGKGLFCAMDLPDGDKRAKLRELVFEQNVVVLGSGQNSIRFRPPLVINKNHIDEAVNVIDSCLAKM
jgi:L-lysine 6-transaminase